MTDQLARILEYVDILNEVDTENVEPMAHADRTADVFREDVDRSVAVAGRRLGQRPEDRRTLSSWCRPFSKATTNRPRGGSRHALPEQVASGRKRHVERDPRCHRLAAALDAVAGGQYVGRRCDDRLSRSNRDARRADQGLLARRPRRALCGKRKPSTKSVARDSRWAAWPDFRRAQRRRLHEAGSRRPAASRILQNFVPPTMRKSSAGSATADAVLIGKTNMDEFAMGSSTENSAFQIDPQSRGTPSGRRADRAAVRPPRWPREWRPWRSAATRAVRSGSRPASAASSG